MIPKAWIEQDFILIGFSRGAFILLIICILAYSLLCYGIGRGVVKGWFKRFWWRWFWWIGYYG